VVRHAEDSVGVDAEAEAKLRQARAERLGGLLQRAQEGDRDCLRGIVAELTPLLWNVARGQDLVRADAEDVVQQVWLSLISRLAAIETPTALIGWLVMATRREAWRVRRAGERTRAVDTDELVDVADPAEPAEERVLAEERRQMIRDALSQLTPRCAELLRALAFSDRPDYGTVARALGMPRGSIGPSRGRCLARLRTVLITDPRWSSLCP
jgi:RNA polymerase sigma factor (sigma-70 family)